MRSFPHIWETDISGFFNNVNHGNLYSILCVAGVPAFLALRILYMQQTPPKLPQGNLSLPPNPQADEVPETLHQYETLGTPSIFFRDSHEGSKKVQYYEDK